MPRAKFVSSKYVLLYNELGNFKNEYPEYLYDFKLIYQDIVDYFNNDSDYFNNLKIIIRKLEAIDLTPIIKNRFYIITDISTPVLAVLDMDDPVVDALIDDNSFLFENVPDKVLASYISKLYIFKGKKLCKTTHLSPRQVAMYMAVFKKENLINYQGAMDDIRAKPRREAKRKS